MDLTDQEISVLESVFDLIRDRIRHYPDHADMGWDADDLAAFNSLDAKHYAEAKKRKLWWARNR